MNCISSIGFALDPSNVPSFLIDWEVTKKCNMACSYCISDVNFGGRYDHADHPPLAECLETIKFMYSYVDEYMKYKKPTQRKVVLNVYGGEALLHPDIVEILESCRNEYAQYSDKWHLTITSTTNALMGSNLWSRIVSLIDEFTCSYHSEMTDKQKDIFKKNVLYLRDNDKRFKVLPVMHNDPELFKDAEQMIDFCKQNNLRYHIKPLDNSDDDFSYRSEEYGKLKTIWISSVNSKKDKNYETQVEKIGEGSDKVKGIEQGRSCCGGRSLSINGDLKSNVRFIPRQGFKDWYCSVNWFFLSIRQNTKTVWVNKDCKHSTVTNKVEPLGYLTDTKSILDTLKTQLETKSMPVIQCVKNSCICGFCAPKAENYDEFSKLLKRHVVDEVFVKRDQ